MKNFIKKFDKEIMIDILVEIVGSFLVAIALYNFAATSDFPMTGFSGVALIFYRLFGFKLGVTTICLNIPVAIFCYKRLGRGFFFRSIRCMLISAVMTDYVVTLLPVYEGERLLAAICTGVFGGIGYAMIYMRNSSTGGSDFIVMAVKSIKPHISLGKIAFLSDIGVIVIGGCIFRDMDGVIYGLIINYLFAIVADKMMYGMNSGKVALIVTEHGEQIADIIDECCSRGTTILNARGGYRKDRKDVVMCACNSKQMYMVEKAVKASDEKAFIIIMEANEVLGEGFRNIRVAEEAA